MNKNPYAGADRDEADRQERDLASEEREARWDAEYPDWENLSQEPEDRAWVYASDVR